jgi:hypothetical protein
MTTIGLQLLIGIDRVVGCTAHSQECFEGSLATRTAVFAARQFEQPVWIIGNNPVHARLHQ